MGKVSEVFKCAYSLNWVIGIEVVLKKNHFLIHLFYTYSFVGETYLSISEECKISC